jgi:hypothetical protein
VQEAFRSQGLEADTGWQPCAERKTQESGERPVFGSLQTAATMSLQTVFVPPGQRLVPSLSHLSHRFSPLSVLPAEPPDANNGYIIVVVNGGLNQQRSAVRF